MMNNAFTRWLLDVDVIPSDASEVYLVWERPLPAWVWVLVVLLAMLFAAWSYSRLSGKRTGRLVLAGARAFVLLLVVLLLCGPSLEMPRQSTEEDWVLVLVDRSESMSIADIENGETRETREQQVRRLLAGSDAMWRSLDEKRTLLWLGFHRGVFDLAADGAAAPSSDESTGGSPKDIGDPTGERSNLDTALVEAMRRAAARPVSGVVVFSDGRSSEAIGRSIRTLTTETVPVFVMPLGSDEPLADLSVQNVDAPRRAFVRDKVPVHVNIARLGSAVGEMGATVKLIDTQTGDVLDSAELAPGEDRDEITLTAKPELAGDAVWQVVIETDQPDLIPNNNMKEIQVELIDRPLRVLLVEGYPRWEYRYLKNLLVREKSIESSVFLVSADRDFAQEGNLPITRLPRSADEIERFDVIIIGDVHAGFFSNTQLTRFAEHVANRPAGLLWIGGSRNTPSTYAGTPLSPLLPMLGSLTFPRTEQPVHMSPTALADRLGVLRLATGREEGWPQELANERVSWSRLSAQHIEPGQLKPTAEVLAETSEEFSGVSLPLVMSMRYGGGQVIYVATDDIWRWRYARGEQLPEQFWVQLIRMLARESLSGSDLPAELKVTPRRSIAGQPVRFDLELIDSRLAATQGESLAIILETEDGQQITELQLQAVQGEEATYTVTYLPQVTGTIRARVDEPGLTDLQVNLEVFGRDDELRVPETDHELLANLANETGGEVLTEATLKELHKNPKLQNLSRRTINPLLETIWDTPLAFILVLLTITGEWIGRKIIRLV